MTSKHYVKIATDGTIRRIKARSRYATARGYHSTLQRAYAAVGSQDVTPETMTAVRNAAPIAGGLRHLLTNALKWIQ